MKTITDIIAVMFGIILFFSIRSCNRESHVTMYIPEDKVYPKIEFEMSKEQLERQIRALNTPYTNRAGDYILHHHPELQEFMEHEGIQDVEYGISEYEEKMGNL
ncbi:MAG: hypothetical protein DRJ64_08225 [Thermoprotei archaeon]|nr:MAG: hypothetical protein DRJ64_08225 [Thermoprotei archaeon]